MNRTLPRCLPLLLLALAPSCATVPGSGRSQLKLIPQDQEVALGRQAYREALQGAAVVTSGPDYEMVKRVGERVAHAARQLYPDPAKSFDWEFNLIDEPDTANAWALPGGKSAVYTGLLPITRDEDGLAAVLGHEVFHALGHHGVERMSQEFGLDKLLTGVSFYLGANGEDPQKSRRALALLGAGAQVGILLPFSRAHESEADEYGLYLAAAAGYDPNAAIGLWERMGALGGARPPLFLSTHPSEATRIERLRKAMPRAMRYYKRAQRDQGGRP